jgi:hypothetical protein
VHLGPEEGEPDAIKEPRRGVGTFAAVETDTVPKEAHPVAEVEFPNRKHGGPPVRLRVTLPKRC